MSLATNVTATEAEVIRIYEVALPDQDAMELTAKDVAKALGVKKLDDKYVEIFPVSALDALGLTGYMTDGLGIPAPALKDYAERILTVTGHVVVVLSKAFNGKDATLKNGHPLRLIGAFNERKADSMDVDLTSDAASIPTPKPKKQKSEAAQSGMVATYALLLMFAFVGIIVWLS